jgi:hypothetical protein
MLPPHPSERQAPEAHAGSDPEYPQAGDSGTRPWARRSQ